MINFICKKTSDWIELNQPVFIVPSQLGKHARPLHKMSIEVGQLVLGLQIFRNLAEEKTWQQQTCQKGDQSFV